MERWYSIVEYARKFNLSDMTVRRRIKNGKLQAVLKEGKYYIPISAAQHSSNQVQETDESFSSNIRTESIPDSSSNSNSNTIYSNTLTNKKISPSTSYSSSAVPVSPINNHEITEAQPYLKTSVFSSNQEGSSSILKTTPSVSTNNIPRTSFQETRTRSYQPTDSRQVQQASSFMTNYDNMVQQFKRFEKILEDSYTSKINQLESELKIQKLENANLKQQVEDLQVLIKLIEKKK